MIRTAFIGIGAISHENVLGYLDAPNATLYVNLEEAGLLLQDRFADAPAAARALHARGAARVLVTDGASMAADCGPGGLNTAVPPQVLVTRVTGAGDTFMAAHIAAETRGDAAEPALQHALRAAADYVSGDIE